MYPKYNISFVLLYNGSTSYTSYKFISEVRDFFHKIVTSNLKHLNFDIIYFIILNTKFESPNILKLCIVQNITFSNRALYKFRFTKNLTLWRKMDYILNLISHAFPYKSTIPLNYLMHRTAFYHSWHWCIQIPTTLGGFPIEIANQIS